jgi:drug/metabolite transporter (DMT)-like permease
MLRRSLSSLQWLSIALLSLGVGVVQLASSTADAKHHVHSHDSVSPSGTSASVAKRALETVSEGGMNQLLGLIAIILACLSSGFSGVYFEKVLKKKSTPPALPIPSSPSSDGDAPIAAPLQPIGRKTGLWVRNIQLSLFSLLVGSIIYLATAQSLSSLSASVFLEGFTPIVWVVVFVQILGGLLAAVVIQYADNIAKSFSASMSIILSFGASVWLFNYRLNTGVVVGSAMVMGATWLFSMSTLLRERNGEKEKSS